MLEYGSIPAMSECTLLQRKTLQRNLEIDFQFCFWVVFVLLRQKSCVSQANVKPPL